jgi:rfaE bifunctional protein nucleotidyltransferase chain/domain
MKIKKILDLDKLSSLVAKYKKRKRKIVLCHGVFDLLHLGHIKHFEEAKKHGDVLIVTVTPDNYVYKGPNKPVFSLQQRIETLAALQTVDFVAANKWESAIETIKIVKPNIYCKGPDYKDNSLDYTKKILEEKKAIKSIGGKIEYTSDETIFSSSNILNKFGDVYSDNQKSIIQKISKKLNFKQINKMIDELKNLKVLVIGETIIDQYYFCEALGKSGKEPTLVLRDLNMEQYPGGAAAVA